MIKKILLVFVIIFLFIGVTFSQPASASSLDKVRIRISAGVARTNFGMFGLGYTIVVKNFGWEVKYGRYEIEYSSKSGEVIDKESKNIEVEPRGFFMYGTIKYFINPQIIYLKISVEADNKNASKTGLLIGPFVLFLS